MPNNNNNNNNNNNEGGMKKHKCMICIGEYKNKFMGHKQFAIDIL
jgi:hypothetical protein